jgi:hypothetical protein
MQLYVQVIASEQRQSGFTGAALFPSRLRPCQLGPSQASHRRLDALSRDGRQCRHVILLVCACCQLPDRPFTACECDELQAPPLSTCHPARHIGCGSSKRQPHRALLTRSTRICASIKTRKYLRPWFKHPPGHNTRFGMVLNRLVRFFFPGPNVRREHGLPGQAGWNDTEDSCTWCEGSQQSPRFLANHCKALLWMLYPMLASIINSMGGKGTLPSALPPLD